MSVPSVCGMHLPKLTTKADFLANHMDSMAGILKAVVTPLADGKQEVRIEVNNIQVGRIQATKG